MSFFFYRFLKKSYTVEGDDGTEKENKISVVMKRCERVIRSENTYTKKTKVV